MAVYEQKKSKLAPSNIKGFIRWSKDNLFSTPLNVALTFLGLALVFW
jgi:general L-amino acid transport system permease protein